MIRWMLMLMGVLGVTLMLPAQAQTEAPRLNRCVNLGNMLEAPREGEWGLVVQQDFLVQMADAGFDTVRIPVKWSGHADQDAPYTIEPAFMRRVQQVVDWALAQDLQAVLNIHHYDEMAQNPAAHEARLIGLWQQIAAHFADYPAALVFELLNEPNTALTADRWNALYPQLIETVRASNPTRQIIFGPVNWNSLYALDELELPDDRSNLIVTFHYYEPFQFTHQGAEWVDGSGAWRGTIWGTRADYRRLDEDFAAVKAWAETHQVPVWLGEFGAYSAADPTSRRLYTQAVRESAEANGIGWCYWELASGFGIYDARTQQFNDLYRALIP